MKISLPISLPIAQPPWTKLGRRLERMCRKALYDFELLDGIEELGIALSGGKDSLALLFLLHAISGRGFPKLRLHAIHVSGAFSCGASLQENFLKSICDAMGVGFSAVKSEQKMEKLECYRCSRERRRLIFSEAKRVNVERIAFGHHRDDSNQTLIMNLLHKGEFVANLPKVKMFDYGVTIIRPLLYISEDEIRNFAKLYDFHRITCQCPVGQNSMRKKSEEIMKDLESVFPNARKNLFSAGLNYGSDKALKP